MFGQLKIFKPCNNIVLYEFLWIRRTCDYILLNAHYWVVFSSRVRVRIRIRIRIRFSVWLCTCMSTTFDGHCHTVGVIGNGECTLGCSIVLVTYTVVGRNELRNNAI